MDKTEYVPDEMENAFVKTNAGVKFYIKGALIIIYTKEAAEELLLKEFGTLAVEYLNKYGYFKWLSL